MIIKNFLEMEPIKDVCHDGEGLIKIISVFDKEFTTPLQFLHYTVLPPLTSIGAHKHGDDEEIYIILEGSGIMEVDGVKRDVKKGDVILNRPFGTHALRNTSESDELIILVIEAKN